jgi:hypothetical protein
MKAMKAWDLFIPFPQSLSEFILALLYTSSRDSCLPRSVHLTIQRYIHHDIQVVVTRIDK